LIPPNPASTRTAASPLVVRTRQKVVLEDK
jgi:hypothetical protein